MENNVRYLPAASEGDATHVQIPIGVYRAAFDILLDQSVRAAGAIVSALRKNTVLLQEVPIEPPAIVKTDAREEAGAFLEDLAKAKSKPSPSR